MLINAYRMKSILIECIKLLHELNFLTFYTHNLAYNYS